MLDPGVIANLKELESAGNPGLLENLVSLFRRKTPEAIAELEAGLEQAHAGRIARCTHSLGSSSANLGAAKLSRLARELEACALAGDLAPAAGLIRGLKEEYQAVSAELLALVSHQSL